MKRKTADATEPSSVLADAMLISTVMGPPEIMRTTPASPGSVLCSWSHPSLGEYEVPPTSALVIALHTFGPGARALLGRSWSNVALPGSVHVVPPDCVTRWKIGGSIGAFTLHLAEERIRTLFDRAGAASKTLPHTGFRFAIRDRYLQSASRELAHEIDDPTETGSLYVDVLIDGIILRLLRLGEAGARRNERPRSLTRRELGVVCELIEASLESGITLEELASEVQLSRFHLARAFKSSMGLPPHRYMTLRRIERAKKLLADPERPIAEIALDVGFSSQSHLGRAFREITGLTPLRYRKRSEREAAASDRSYAGELAGCVAQVGHEDAPGRPPTSPREARGIR